MSISKEQLRLDPVLKRHLKWRDLKIGETYNVSLNNIKGTVSCYSKNYKDKKKENEESNKIASVSFKTDNGEFTISFKESNSDIFEALQLELTDYILYYELTIEDIYGNKTDYHYSELVDAEIEYNAFKDSIIKSACLKKIDNNSVVVISEFVK